MDRIQKKSGVEFVKRSRRRRIRTSVHASTQAPSGLKGYFSVWALATATTLTTAATVKKRIFVMRCSGKREREGERARMRSEGERERKYQKSGGGNQLGTFYTSGAVFIYQILYQIPGQEVLSRVFYFACFCVCVWCACGGFSPHPAALVAR